MSRTRCQSAEAHPVRLGRSPELSEVNSSPSSLPLSRTDYVLERLKRDLQDGWLKPGDPIRQTTLAKRYGVSPTPVREALRILDADGAITYSTHKGATVRDYSPEAAMDLYRVKAETEGLAVRIAVERMTDERAERIEQQHQALVNALKNDAPPEKLSKLNKEFHFAIYEDASPLIADFITLIWKRFTPPVTLWRGPDTIGVLEGDHVEILKHIRERDAEAAGAAMREHVLHASRLREQKEDLRAVGTAMKLPVSE